MIKEPDPFAIHVQITMKQSEYDIKGVFNKENFYGNCKPTTIKPKNSDLIQLNHTGAYGINYTIFQYLAKNQNTYRGKWTSFFADNRIARKTIQIACFKGYIVSLGDDRLTPLAYFRVKNLADRYLSKRQSRKFIAFLAELKLKNQSFKYDNDDPIWATFYPRMKI